MTIGKARITDKYHLFQSLKNTQQWRTNRECEIITRIEQLKCENDTNDKLIAKLESELKELCLDLKSDWKPLLYATGDELVASIKKCFETFGFTVDCCDTQTGDEKDRKEDLRLQLSSMPEWEGIVEIKGYGRSSGKIEDLTQLKRYREMYYLEKNKYPDAVYYVVNGQIELSIDQRQRPFESNRDIVSYFASDDGCIIATKDLYLTVKNMEMNKIKEIQEKIAKCNERIIYSQSR